MVFWTKNVFWSKIYFGAFANSLILNHLTSNFPQYFSDRSLIKIRRKKNQNGGNFLMTSWQKNAVTSWQVAIWNFFLLPNWSYIIFRKSQKISGQTSKGFSKYAAKYTAAGPLPPPVWAGLKICDSVFINKGYRPNSAKVFTLFYRLLTPSTCLHMESWNFSILFSKSFFVLISPQASQV